MSQPWRMALHGLKVVEFAGLAPAPFCGMVLSDFGAEVIKIDKPNAPTIDAFGRGKKSIVIDLKQPEGRKIVEKLCHSADVLVEPFRAGVMEKLELGPDRLTKLNPRLIYARLTGYGQEGQLSMRAGHDINYLSMAGVLDRLGQKDEKPVPPVNLLADFAGGGLMCAMGIAMALVERSNSGQGQVIDCNMVEGAAYVSSFLWTGQKMGLFTEGRGQGMLDGGAHFYNTYETSDGKYVAVGAVEPQFYAQLLNGLGLSEDDAPQYGEFDRLTEEFKKIFKTKTQKMWTDIFLHTDATVTPVLTPVEAATDPLTQKSFLREPSGDYVPRPAPTLKRTPAVGSVRPEPLAGQHTVEILRNAGFSAAGIKHFLSSGIVSQSDDVPSSRL